MSDDHRFARLPIKTIAQCEEIVKQGNWQKAHRDCSCCPDSTGKLCAGTPVTVCTKCWKKCGQVSQEIYDQWLTAMNAYNNMGCWNPKKKKQKW